MDVELERRWLTDVGFGYFSLAPLDIDAPDKQVVGDRRLRVAREAGAFAAEALGMIRRWGYRFDLEPRRTEDFVEAESARHLGAGLHRVADSTRFVPVWAASCSEAPTGGKRLRRRGRPPLTALEASGADRGVGRRTGGPRVLPCAWMPSLTLGGRWRTMGPTPTKSVGIHRAHTEE